MCNEYEFETKWEEYSRIMAREALDLPTRQSQFDLLLKTSIKIGESATVIRVAGNGVDGADEFWLSASPKGGWAGV